MSISAMLDGGTLPPPAPSSSRQQDLSPLKAPFTPEFGAIDRSREVGSSSASPSSVNTSIQGLPGSKQTRVTPPEPVYRAHHQLQHHSNTQAMDRDVQYSGPMYGQRAQPPPPPPPRPQSQPHGLPGMRDDGQQRHMRAGSFSEREMYNERGRQIEREMYYEKERAERERELEREREQREREQRERGMREREARERERQMMEQEARERERREREQREQEREREREQRERAQQRELRERENRERERVAAERERFGGYNLSMFGRERMELPINPQSSPYGGMSMASRFGPTAGSQNGMPQNGPSAAPTSNPSAMSLPQTIGPGNQGYGHSHSQMTGPAREGYGPFSGYSASMPQSPFSISPNLPLPTIGDDARDRDARPQRFKPSREASSGGREEPLRAEDALQRGLGRSLSSLMEEEKKRTIGKDRDGIIRDKDGIMRLSDSALTWNSSPKRSTSRLEFDIGHSWGARAQEVEKDRDGRERLSAGLGMGMKRDREDDEGSSKTEKKKRHHHHTIPHQSVPQTLNIGPPTFGTDNSSAHLNHHHHHHEDISSNTLDAPKIAAVRSKSPLQHHHHHVHHVHTPISAAQQQSPLPKVSTTLLIDSSKVVASLNSKPRHYLGSIVYLPTPAPKEGYSVTQPLFPRFEGKENSIFQVRIPKRFLSDAHRRDVCRRRCVWGSEIYTDDSDIIGVLIHTGRIPGWLPDDVDPALVKETGRKVVVRGAVTPSTSPTPPSGKWKVNGAAAAATAAAKKAAEEKEKEQGPHIEPGKDLIVNILILPTLERYTGSVRNALKSRSWNTIHDGVSYSIWDMEWVEAGEAESRGGGSKKRRLNEREWIRQWGELPPSRGGPAKEREMGRVPPGVWREPQSGNNNGIGGEVEIRA
jgi:flagellar biosynthesis GTPase FlhF